LRSGTRLRGEISLSIHKERKMIRAISKTRQTGLNMLMVDLKKDNKISKETLRYFIEHRINIYAQDVKEVYKKFEE